MKTSEKKPNQLEESDFYNNDSVPQVDKRGNSNVTPQRIGQKKS